MTAQSHHHPLDPYLERGLSQGRHSHLGDPRCCAMEAFALAKGLPKTDSPCILGIPDLGALNDAYGVGERANAARTASLGPVLKALYDWSDWTEKRRNKFKDLLRKSDRAAKDSGDWDTWFHAQDSGAIETTGFEILDRWAKRFLDAANESEAEK